MPVYECARCNELTYSASAGAGHRCGRCGADRHRVLDATFAGVRDAPREFGAGDHATVAYDDPADVAFFFARYLTDGVNRGDRVVAAIPPDLRDAVRSLLAEDVRIMIEWMDTKDVYDDFDADRVAAQYEALFAEEERCTRVLAGVDRESAEGVDPGEMDRYEQIAHDILHRHRAIAICAYDTRALEPAFLTASELRHPLVVTDGALRRNESFVFEPA